MSKINNTNRDITKAIFSALNESAQAEASMWEADNRTYKDIDEAEYYRNKELYYYNHLAKYRDAMEKAKRACEKKGIKLESEEIELPSTSDGTAKQEIEDQLERTRNRKEKVGIEESAPYRRYKVSFYVDTNEMNNMDIEERLNEVLKGSGLASADETIDVEMVEEFEESSLKEERVHMQLHKGDTFVNPNGVECIITSVDNEHLLDGEPQVTYKIGKDYKCYKMSSVVGMLNQNRYKRVD